MTVLSWRKSSKHGNEFHAHACQSANFRPNVYTIRGELDEDYVHETGRITWMKKCAPSRAATSTVDTQRVAVLAALAIADELHGARRDIGVPRRCVARTSRALPHPRRTRPQTIRLTSIRTRVPTRAAPCFGRAAQQPRVIPNPAAILPGG